MKGNKSHLTSYMRCNVSNIILFFMNASILYEFSCIFAVPVAISSEQDKYSASTIWLNIGCVTITVTTYRIVHIAHIPCILSFLLAMSTRFSHPSTGTDRIRSMAIRLSYKDQCFTYTTQQHSLPLWTHTSANFNVNFLFPTATLYLTIDIPVLGQGIQIFGIFFSACWMTTLVLTAAGYQAKIDRI